MRKLIYLLFVLILVPSCKEDPVTPDNAYAGSYRINLSGSATGTGTFSIDKSGALSGSATVQGSTSTMTATVSASGQVSDGKGFENGQQISTFSGQFSSNTNANGTWQSTEGGSGTWTAVKQ